MPRGRKRKVPPEETAESAEESMDEPMESQEPEEQVEQPEVQEEGETEEANEALESGEVETPVEMAEMTEMSEMTDTVPAEEDEDLEPGEVVAESNECPPLEELKKIKTVAQVDMTRLDVLICGKCHNAFHLVEELVEHKLGCIGNSTIISATTKSDNKPQVWAFVLYKAYKMRESGETKDANERSWVLYQKWSGLDEHLKATWVAAGKALMGIQQYAIPVKKNMTPRHHMHAAQMTATEQHKQTLIQLQKELEDDEPAPVPTPKGRNSQAKRQKRDEEETHVERGEVRKRAGLNQVWRKSMRQGADEMETELFTVEKIVAKRANPKLKSAEYLVRWAGLPTDQNSWEHASNLLTCKPIVEEFERNLARQKARKAAEAARLTEKTAIQNAGGRPVRTSALRALDQVKEWVGGREVEEEEEYQMVTPTGMKKRAINTPNKNPLIMASSRGVLKLDQSNMANLSSGVYIISDQSGLVKVEDRAASKLTSCLNDTEGAQVNNRTTMMINETEVRKISGNKYATFRKDSSGLVRKENNSSLALGQKRGTPKSGQRPMMQQRARAPGVLANRHNSQTLLGRSGGGGQQKLMRIVSEDNSVLTSEDGSINISGSMLGEDVNETMVEEGDLGVADVDDDGLMRMAISPGGSLHQIVQQRPKQQEQQIAQGTEMIQIEGEDGVIYNLTPEQQQMLLQNGTLTMDTKQESLEENTEMVIENGQIVRRMIGAGAEAESGEEGTFMLAGDNLQNVKVEQEGEGEEDSMLTLQSAVQEAVQGPRIQLSTDEGTIDCVIASADPLQPGATARNVLLQAADGTLFSTEMEEEQFQSFGFEAK